MINNEDFQKGMHDGLFTEPISKPQSEEYLKGYFSEVRRTKRFHDRMNLIQTGIVVVAFPLLIHMLNFDRELRENKIVSFYQRYGSCPRDATPAYLDFRVQAWQREVEGR